MQQSHILCRSRTLTHYHVRPKTPATGTTRSWLQSVSAMAASPASRPITNPAMLPPEKVELLKSLDGWVGENILPILKPVDKSWQPHDFLPNPSLPSDEFVEQVLALRERTAELPDDYLVVLVGDLITEEALPTYMSNLNRMEGINDETGASPDAWSVWIRSWTAEENRHGDLLNKYLYLSGRVNMHMVESTIQHLIRFGMSPISELMNPYVGMAYTSFQERATFITHGRTAHMAKQDGDPVLARICGTIAAEEKRHEHGYQRIVEKLLEVDSTDAMLGIATMLRQNVTMPAHMMYDGENPNLFNHFSIVTQKLGVYTFADYADILEFLIGRWKLEKLVGLNGQAREAQDFVCGLPRKIRKIQERAEERARKMKPQTLRFSWIFNKELTL